MIFQKENGNTFTLLIIFIVKSLQSKIAQIYYYDPQCAGINLQSPQSDSTPWTLTLFQAAQKTPNLIKLFQKCCFTFLIEERFFVTLFSFMFDTFHDMFLGKLKKKPLRMIPFRICDRLSITSMTSFKFQMYNKICD